MTVHTAGNVVHLEGHCRVEEAETLLLALQEAPEKVLDVSSLTRLHAALAQIIIAARPRLQGVPSDPFLRDWLLPLLRRVD